MSYKHSTRKRSRGKGSRDATERVYRFLRDWTSAKGAPPTLREIALHLGYSSPNSVRYHLKLLEEMGKVRRSPRHARGTMPETSSRKTRSVTEGIPIIGRVAAGVPLMAEENWEGELPLETSWLGSGTFFALRVQGDSMTGVGIHNGDLALIRKRETAEDGDIVLALLNDEATIKRFRHRGGRVWLKAENPGYKPIRVTKSSDLRILGVIVGLYRSIKVK
jgi:repressor LexA